MQKNYRSNVLNHFKKHKQQEAKKEQEEKENRLIVGKEVVAEAAELKENDVNDLAMVNIKIDGDSKEDTNKLENDEKNEDEAEADAADAAEAATITTNIEMISITKKHRYAKGKKGRTVLIIDDNVFCREFFGDQVCEILKSNNPAPFVVDVIGDNVRLLLFFLFLLYFTISYYYLICFSTY